MNEIKKCSIAGIAFTCDVTAYEELNNYLKSLEQAYQSSADGREIIADIEARIAELILSAQDADKVVSTPLIRNIINQLGSAEDITDDADKDLDPDTSSRIARRLYRSMEGAKLGGVCMGLAKYFNVQPVWLRLALFIPLLLGILCSGTPLRVLLTPMMLNLWLVAIVCYMILWFSLPTARTARQKLEMEGRPITARSVAAATAQGDVDQRAKPVVADAVTLIGRLVIFLVKFFAVCLTIGLVLVAGILIVTFFAVLITNNEFAWLPWSLSDFSIWYPLLSVLIILMPIVVLIHLLMCLVSSRNPSGRALLIMAIVWFLEIGALGALIYSDRDELRTLHEEIQATEHDDEAELNALKHQLNFNNDFEFSIREDEGGFEIHAKTQSPS